MSKKANKGVCSICGLEATLTFEHLPPEKAGNIQPVYMKDHRHLIPININLHGKQARSHRGMGDFKTCKDCNNKTGQWYAKDYVSLYNSFMAIMNEKHNFTNDHGMLKFEVNIKPLNILKQILIHHLCADQSLGWIRSLIKGNNFILNKSEKNLTEDIRIFMYATSSPVHRFQGMSQVLGSDSEAFNNYSEFSFHPFGTLIAINSNPPSFPPFMEITNFKNFNYDEDAKVSFCLPHIEIKTLGAGYYP